MRWVIKISIQTIITLFLVSSNVSNGFDLVSTLLSQGSRLPLHQLKSLLSSPTVQRMLHSNGIPSLESLRGSDPSQLQKILTRLRPKMQGRIDPQVLELLARSVLDGPPQQQQQGATSSEDVSMPPPPPRRKFSSKFRRRKATTPLFLLSSTEIPGGILQFDQVDPNIGNHNLNGWRSQNFTTIDRTEDLMMDESFSQPPSLIPLLEESNEVNNAHVPENGNTGHWVSTTASTTESTEDPPREFTREPLQKSSNEKDLILTHFLPRNPTKATYQDSSEQYFRPSPPDHRRHPPQFYEPGQDFYTSTIRNNVNRMGQQPPQYIRRHSQGHPPFSSMKQDRILNVGSKVQGHNYGNQGQETNVRYQYARPSHYPGNAYQGQNSHPFAHYKEIGTMYSPSHYHHNKFHYLNPNYEHDLDQSPATDKNDGGWSSTLFLLGGIVAASTLIAFVLPSILPSMSGGIGKKENEGSAAASGTNAQNTDFWNEVKGLYSDLTHLARGDFNHFDSQSESSTTGGGKVGDDESDEERTTNSIRRVDTEDSSEEVNVRWKKEEAATVGHRDDLATPVPIFPIPISMSTGGGRPMVAMRNSNSSFLQEWAKVQLKVMDS